MGLDMFLFVQKNDAELTAENFFNRTVEREEVGYWRKANMVHKFFCSRGKELDPQTLYILSREHLVELLKICHDILDEKVEPETALPTQDGFFFGSTEYGEMYYEDIKSTIIILSDVLLVNKTSKDVEEFIYYASW